MELELRDFLRLARRWWWLILIAPLTAGLAARTIETQREAAASPEYEASAQILVNPSQTTGRPYYGVYTYSELVLSQEVLKPVITALQLPDGVEELRARITAEPVLDPAGRATEVIEVTVRDTDPELAAETATRIAKSLVDYVGQHEIELTEANRNAVAQQISNADQEIADTEQQIAELERASNRADPAVKEQLDTLRTTLTQQQETLANLETAAQVQAMTPEIAQVSLADPAIVPADPVPISKLPIVSLSAVAGFLVAAAAILFLAYLDTTVKPSLDFMALAGSPLISVLPRVPRLRAGASQLFVVERPRAEASEAIRLLRTNIEFASDVSTLNSLAISSPGPGEGRSTLTANLAVAMAQAGFNIVVIDADLRKPSQHAIFDTSNGCGLTNLLSNPDLPWTMATAKTRVPNLTLIPSGPAWPTTPADLLSRDRLPELLAEISSTVDLVLLDTPPLLSASDALAVADHVDGVLLTCRSGRTRIDALQNAAGALHRGAIRIVGVVMTWQSRRDERFHPLPASSGWAEAMRRPIDYRPTDRPVDPSVLNPMTSVN